MTLTAHASAGGLAQPCLPAATVDKWDILTALTQAAADFGLSHRTLGVLRALLTFHPGREISPDPHAAIVFPANRTLSDRLNGMPESTLRRHLAQLVRLGVVERRDSPNHKRFARRIGQHIAVAFGFDLSPLARAATQIARAAADRKARAEEIAVLRQRVIMLRQAVIDADGPDVLTETARLMLRRKAEPADLEAMAATLNDRLTPREMPRDTIEMSGSDSRNERHKQENLEYIPDSEAAPTKMSLQDVTAACTEFRCYFPGVVRRWDDLHDIARQIAPMIGIEVPVMIAAQRTLGRDAASVAVLCMLERLAEIDSPGAYLRHLTRQGQRGGLDVTPMLAAVSARRARRLSADNRANPSLAGA